MPSTRLQKFTAAALACVLAITSLGLSAVLAHSSLEVNGNQIADFSGCGVCPIGNHKLPPSVPKTLDPDGLFDYLQRQNKTVRALWGESIRMPSVGEDDGVRDTTPQSCGRSRMSHVAVILSNARITHRESVHFGPSEVYVNDKLVWQVRNFQTAPLMPPSVFDCDKPTCQVRWYWMNIERMNRMGYFQLYVNCFSVKGNNRPIRVIGAKPRDNTNSDSETDGGDCV